MKTHLLLSLVFVTSLGSLNVLASEHYTIDTRGMHAFITFKIKHLGYSWLQGRFDRFAGEFSYDENDPSSNSVNISIDIDSVDSNHAERDKHLKGERFFNAGQFPKATFSSTKWKDLGNGKAVLSGNFNLRGVTKNIDIDVTQTGAGKDPWGGYRRGFEGSTTLQLSDYHMKEGKILGAAAENVEIWLSIEGIRQ